MAERPTGYLEARRLALADDLVEQWHTSPEDGVPLHQFMRLTWDEYKRWVEKASALPADFVQRHDPARDASDTGSS